MTARAAICLLTVGGCWTAPPASTTTTTTATAPTTASLAPPAATRDHARWEPVHAPPPRAPLVAEHTVWVGTYTCNQGLTAVTLSIDADGHDATAVFEFGPLSANPYVPSGASRLVGSLVARADGTFVVDLDPGQWISQPPGWFLVGLRVESTANNQELHGTIKGSGCGSIDLERRR